MKIVCVSDTHLKHDSIVIPKCDLLLHAGDFTMSGTVKEIANFNRWLGELQQSEQIEQAVVIAGNHDLMFEDNPSLARILLTNCHYLQDSEITINGVRIYGSPYQPWFCDWAFNLKTGEELKQKWSLIPDQVDILLTHGPAYGILDQVQGGPHLGCLKLQERLQVVKPRYHVFGHIHDGHGVLKTKEATSINASICDEEYQATNRPTVFSI